MKKKMTKLHYEKSKLNMSSNEQRFKHAIIE